MIHPRSSKRSLFVIKNLLSASVLGIIKPVSPTISILSKHLNIFYAVFALCVCAIGIAGWYTYADVKNYMNHDKSPEISITASEPVNEQAEVKLSGIENENTDNEDISENSDKEEIPSEASTVTNTL